MWKSREVKKTLSDTLANVNDFITNLKKGVEEHNEEIDSINEDINDLYARRTSLNEEVNQAKKLIGTLSGTN